jgi:hypothetical protein
MSKIFLQEIVAPVLPLWLQLSVGTVNIAETLFI